MLSTDDKKETEPLKQMKQKYIIKQNNNTESVS